MVFPLLVICDVGPDPDDMKALLLAAVLHRLRECRLTIVANGGQQPRERAKLALCVLDRLGISDVAVGVGSQGKAYVAKPHEYRLDGYERTSDSRLVEDGDALILSVLRAARAKTVRVVCISSLRDIANALSAQPNLVLAKVRVLAIQGGLERDEHGAWRPDQAVNNGFDPEAADRVYRFCFERGLPLNVVSRFAVPVLPMQLAKSFATRTSCPVMRYLADAQFLGLEGLWHNLCAGRLPPRCSKQWFFETFCGIDSAQFDAHGYESLDADANILAHLNGFVKPYDVVALMMVLPATAHLFPRQPEHAPHMLLLHAADALPVEPVIELLRDVFHQVITLTSARAAHAQRVGMSSWQRDRGERADAATCQITPIGCAGASEAVARRLRAPSVHVRMATRMPGELVAATPRARRLLAEPRSAALHDGQPGVSIALPLDAHAVQRALNGALECALERQRTISSTLLGTGLFALLGCPIAHIADSAIRRAHGQTTLARLTDTDADYVLRTLLYSLGTSIGALLCNLSVQPTAAHRARARAILCIGVGIFALLGGLTVLPDLLALLATSPAAYDGPHVRSEAPLNRAAYWHAVWCVHGALRVAQYVALSCASLLGLGRWWRSVRALLRLHWRVLAAWLLANCALEAHAFSRDIQTTHDCRSTHDGTRCWGPWVACALFVVECAIACAMLMPGSRRTARAAIARALVRAQRRPPARDGRRVAPASRAAWLASAQPIAADVRSASSCTARSSCDASSARRASSLPDLSASRDAALPPRAEPLPDAFLAALLGFGSGQIATVETVVSEAARLFLPEPLDEATLAELHLPSRAPEQHASPRGGSVGEGVPSPLERASSIDRVVRSRNSSADNAAQGNWSTLSLRGAGGGARRVSTDMATLRLARPAGCGGLTCAQLRRALPASSGAGLVVNGSMRMRSRGGRLSRVGGPEQGASRTALVASGEGASVRSCRGPNNAAAAAAAVGGGTLGSRLPEPGSAPSSGTLTSRFARGRNSGFCSCGAVPLNPAATSATGSASSRVSKSCRRRSNSTASGTVLPFALTSDAGSAAAPERSDGVRSCDAYIVHSPLDDPRARADALRVWAHQFSERHGRVPSVWLDALSADASLLPCELLAHSAAYIGWSRRLVLLVGPNLTNDLKAVAEIYTWIAMGGLAADIDIALAVATPSERRSTAAAFDTFHVMHARCDAGAMRSALALAVELATVGSVNRVVRELTSAVSSAAAVPAALDDPHAVSRIVPAPPGHAAC